MFEECPYAWYLKYIQREKDIVGNVYSEFGSFCHKLLELYEKGVIHKHDLPSKYEDGFFDNITSFDIGKNDPTDKLYDFGYEYFTNINIDLSKIKPLYVEKNILFDYKGYNFRGIIDLMYRDENEGLIILDHKTSEYPLTKSGAIKKSKIKTIEDYTKQLCLYAYGVSKITGELPKKIGWNFIRTGDFYFITITKEMVIQAMDWAVSVIKKIYDTEDFTKSGGYIKCSKLCDFRNVC